MNDPTRTISVMSAMARLSSTAMPDEPEPVNGEALSRLTHAGKSLAATLMADDDSDGNAAALYEQFGEILSEFKRRSQIETILNAFSEEALALDNIELSAAAFAKMKMLAVLSDGPWAAEDVESALYQAVEKCKARKGTDTADRFVKFFDYSYAGASLSLDFALAKADGNAPLAGIIEQKAAEFTQSLSTDPQLADAFSASFRLFSSYADSLK